MWYLAFSCCLLAAFENSLHLPPVRNTFLQDVGGQAGVEFVRIERTVPIQQFLMALVCGIGDGVGWYPAPTSACSGTGVVSR